MYITVCIICGACVIETESRLGYKHCKLSGTSSLTIAFAHTRTHARTPNAHNSLCFQDKIKRKLKHEPILIQRFSILILFTSLSLSLYLWDGVVLMLNKLPFVDETTFLSMLHLFTWSHLFYTIQHGIEINLEICMNPHGTKRRNIKLFKSFCMLTAHIISYYRTWCKVSFIAHRKQAQYSLPHPSLVCTRTVCICCRPIALHCIIFLIFSFHL